MKKTILICSLVLLSGCGLFKKVSKEKETESGTVEVTVQKTDDTRRQEVQQKETQKNVVDVGSSTIYVSKDATVEIDARGNFKGRADSIKTTGRLHDQSRVSETTTAETVTKTATDTRVKSSSKHKVSRSDSTTDWKLYVFIGVMIAFVGLVFWLRFRP